MTSTQPWTPLEIFQLFVSMTVADTIVASTNAYAARLKAKWPSFRWYNVTAKEFYCVFAIIIFMGMVDVPTISSYWSSDSFFGQDFIQESGMSRNRFANILSALHICDLEEDDENQRKKGRCDKYDPLLKVRPVMEHL